MIAVDLTPLRQFRPSLNRDPVILVLDDDIATRKSLESLIHTAGWRVETYNCACEVLSRPRELVPGCLVLELDLKQISGLELQRLLADRVEMPIVFITRHPDIPATVQAIKAGAVQVLTKPLDRELVLNAVREAISRSATALERQAESRALAERFATLSRREREVMGLVSTGLLNKQVGAQLGISEITVKLHRGRTMRKMQLCLVAIVDTRRMSSSARSAPVIDRCTVNRRVSRHRSRPPLARSAFSIKPTLSISAIFVSGRIGGTTA
jgi:FixJ family two-component response regulator